MYMDAPKKEKAMTRDAPKRQSSGSHVAHLTAKLGNAGAIRIGPPPPTKKNQTVPPHTPDTSHSKSKKMAKVLHSYTPENSDEIELNIGDLVEIIKQEEEGWWEGRTASGKEGLFPSNFVQFTTDDEFEKIPEEDAEFHEIKGKKTKGVGFGNIFGEGPIKLRKTHEDSQENNKTEPPPMMKATKKTPPPTVPNDAPALPPKETKETTRQCERARVLYSYSAENEDELGLTEGEIITILEKELEDSGWWKGELNGKVGVFPDNFVELLPPEEVSKPRKPPPPAVPPNNTKHKAERPPPPEPVESPKPVKKEPREERKAPVAGKKPAPPPLQPKDNHLDLVEPRQKLSHPTANRAKAPARRPPTTSVRNSRDEILGSEESVEEVKEQGVAEEEPHDEVPKVPDRRKPRPMSLQMGRPLPSLEGRVKEEGRAKEEGEETKAPPLQRPPPPVHRDESPRSPAKESPRSPVIGNDKDSKHHRTHHEGGGASAHHEGAASPAEIKSLKAEVEHLKSSTVSRKDYDSLRTELTGLREEMNSMRNQFKKRINELMEEVDEEKKHRLNTQVQIERVKKLVMDS